MIEWIQKYQKILSRVVGILLIIGAVTALFWDNTGDAVSVEEQRAAANVARMEARMSGSTATQHSTPDKPVFMQAYREKQEEQLRYAVIVILIMGVGFVGYSFLKREES